MTTPSSLAIAYLDPTALIPIVFGEEPVGAVTQKRLNQFPVLLSSTPLRRNCGGDSSVRTKSSILTGYPASTRAARVAKTAELAAEDRMTSPSKRERGRNPLWIGGRSER